MNPLSAWTYYRRHKLQTVLMIALVGLTAMGLYLLPALAQETFMTPDRTIRTYLQRFNLVQPLLEKNLNPAIVSQIRAHPDAATVLQQNNLEISVPNISGADFEFRLLGLQEADVATVMAQSGVTLKEGAMLQPRTNGLLLSESIALALDLEVGDTLFRSADTDLFGNVVSPLQVVGILSGDVRLGIVSYEYLTGHELYRDRVTHGVLVIAQPGRHEAMEGFLMTQIRSPYTETYTFQWADELAKEQEYLLYTFGIPIVLMVAIATTLVTGAINRIAFTRRLPEFGTLHATGHSKRWLTRRLTLETAGLSAVGWALGVGVACGTMVILSTALYEPRGFSLNPFLLTPLLLTIPIPLSVIGFTLAYVTRAFSQMDTVAIVEQGELSMEKKPRNTATLPEDAKSAPNPLASVTFYARHKRRAALLISSMALMIVGITLIIFAFAITSDAFAGGFGNLNHLSVVSASTGELDPGLISQIRSHPAVERVIPSLQFSPFGVAVPPIERDAELTAFAVNADDLAYLVDLYGLELESGNLPRPNTNEIVISKTAAQNRNLEVGTVIGNRDHPIYKGALTLPSDIVVSGIFAQPQTQEDDNWLTFVSLEFMTHYREYWPNEISLLIVPQPGQKATLDAWLENEIASDRVEVMTRGKMLAESERELRAMVQTISLMESGIAVIAALALAGLNYIFVTQRHAEFGVLNALGFGRAQLVWRTIRETLFTIGSAWILSVVLCALILLVMRFAVYTPLGLRINFFNPTPWLFTLPIPFAVLLATTGTITWALSKLDPVAIIERR